MSLLKNAIKVAREFYDEKTYYHAMRVAAYVDNDNLIPEDEKDDCKEKYLTAIPYLL